MADASAGSRARSATQAGASSTSNDQYNPSVLECRHRHSCHHDHCDIRLLAANGVHIADHHRENFSLIFGVDRNRQHLADFTQGSVAVNDFHLNETTVGMANGTFSSASTHCQS
jgi:hypothetical protein